MFIDKNYLKQYEDDVINKLLKSDPSCKNFISHKWLLDSLPKRCIYYEIYGDLLETKEKKRILDVGGGFCAVSKILLKKHNYQLLDIMAHDDHETIRHMENDLFESFWINNDWYNHIPETYDIVIANDIFPNVDQRLELFLEKYIPTTKEIRLSLTYYNTPKFYITKRVDGDEIFCQLAYNGKQVKEILDKYQNKNLDVLLNNSESLFPNGRQVFTTTIKGKNNDRNKNITSKI